VLSLGLGLGLSLSLRLSLSLSLGLSLRLSLHVLLLDLGERLLCSLLHRLRLHHLLMLRRRELLLLVRGHRGLASRTRRLGLRRMDELLALTRLDLHPLLRRESPHHRVPGRTVHWRSHVLLMGRRHDTRVLLLHHVRRRCDGRVRVGWPCLRVRNHVLSVHGMTRLRWSLRR
jgi:hypothetical protein